MQFSDDSAAQDEILLRCSLWWASYKKNLTQSVQDFVSRSTSSTNAVRWRGRLPGSQVLELMRHHSILALARRAQRQFTRLKEKKRWRQTTGA